MREKLHKLFKLTDLPGTFHDFMDMQLAPLGQAFQDEEPQLVEQLTALIHDELNKQMPDVIEKFLRLYEETYNEEDIDAMINWHNSPVGKKCQAVSKSMQAGGFAIGKSMEGKLLERVKQFMKDYEFQNS